MTSGRLVLCAACAMVLPAAVAPCAGADDALDRLTALSWEQPVELRWRISVGDPARPPVGVDYDDSEWQPGTAWPTSRSVAWFRARLRLPSRVGSFRVDGVPLALDLGVDDDGRAYVNATSKGDFHWDGAVMLTDKAAAGDEYMIAVRVVNGPGAGGIRGAKLRIVPPDDSVSPSDLVAQLRFARTLANRHRSDHPEWAGLVDRAQRGVDAPAADLYDYGELSRRLAKSLEALAPLEETAKAYTIHYVGHAHIDMNWLWPWNETVQVCHDTFASALSISGTVPDFRFSQSQCAVYEAVREHYADLYRDMLAAVKQGRWEPTASEWVECDHNIPTGEAFARQLLYAGEYSQAVFGKPSRVLWAPDTFGHSWTIPTLAARAGLRYAYFCRCALGPLFWWQGPDGSRLLCAGGGPGSYAEAVNDTMCDRPCLFEDAAGVKRALVVYGAGDHGGGPTRADVAAIRRQQKRPIWPTCRFSTAEEFFAECERDIAAQQAAGERPRVPVWRGERNTVFTGCYTTHADIKERDRRLSELLASVETATVAAGTADASVPQRLLPAWRRVLFNQFHDILAGTAVHDSYAYSHKLYDDAERTARDVLGDAVGAIGARASTSGGLVVVNPCAWERTEVVELPPGPVDGLAGPNGRAVATQPADGATLALIERVPGCGYLVLRRSGKAAQPVVDNPASVSDQDGTVELGNGLVSATFDKRSGAIVSLRLGSMGRDLVPPGEKVGLLQVDLEDGGNAWEIGAIKGSRLLDAAESVEVVASGPLRASVRSTYRFEASTFALTASVVAGKPYVEYRLDADWQGRNCPEGRPFLKARFPLALEPAAATYEIQCGSIERPANGAEVPALSWADLTEHAPAPRGEHGRVEQADLSPLLDGDALVGPAGGGDFDKDGAALPQAEAPVPGSIVSGPSGIGYRWPEPRGELDSVVCSGQEIEADGTNSHAVGLLVAAAGGVQAAAFELLYRDGASEYVPVQVGDWVGGGGIDQPAVVFPYRLRRDGTREQYQCHVGEIVLTGTRTEPVVGVRLADNHWVRVFAVTFAESGSPMRGEPIVGCALINDSKVGHSWDGRVLRLSLLRCTDEPDPIADQGRHTIRYRLMPHEGDWRRAAVPRAGLDMNRPLLVEPVTGRRSPRTTLGTGSRSMLTVSPETVITTALKPAEGGGLVVRLYSAAEDDTVAQLEFGAEIASAQECDLLENPIGTGRWPDEPGATSRIALDGRSVRLPLRPGEVVTIRVRLR